MILHSGGCGHYQFSTNPDQKWMIVVPARKPGKVYEDYCSKGKVNVQAKISALESFSCFEDPTDCSATACVGNLDSIINPKASGPQQIHIDVCNDPKSQYDAAVWELNFSSSNDSSKLEAVFGDEARQRLRNTVNVPDFDTQLTMVISQF